MVRLALLYNFNLCWADVMAPSTDCLLTAILDVGRCRLTNLITQHFLGPGYLRSAETSGQERHIYDKFWNGPSA